jgi:hypothetical protein
MSFPESEPGFHLIALYLVVDFQNGIVIRLLYVQSLSLALLEDSDARKFFREKRISVGSVAKTRMFLAEVISRSV